MSIISENNWSKEICSTCDVSCLGFEGFSGCIVYNGPDIPELGIKCDMNLNDVISILAGAGQATTSGTTSATREATSTEIKYVPSSGVNTCASKLVNTIFPFSLIPGASTYAFTYDLGPVTSNLPGGFSFVSASVEVRSSQVGTSGIVYSSSSRSGTTNLSVNNIPATVSIRVQLNSECGVIIGTSTLALDPNLTGALNGKIVFTPVGGSGDTEISMTNKIEDLERQINELKVS